MIWAAVDYGALSSTETHGLVCFHHILHGVERQSVVLVFVFVFIIFAAKVRVCTIFVRGVDGVLSFSCGPQIFLTEGSPWLQAILKSLLNRIN